MKKLVLLLASVGLMTAAQAAYKDGTFEGEGEGNHGKITVAVTVKAVKLLTLKS